ncbi:uncharacterized protein [Physcomitrium patens]|uniref:AIR9-like A9 domain-containing protein n=2 Tax=Physcomitrium patens TaxID=3218 RepID=A0A2K1KJI1_PHYPA|nr:uncharacterized protein LOC112282050 isoform X1 [Physcomitrium patens]PNR53938.1 hypothetical protein PHYPA_007613 [Physcomitrium patens]|eukprot:XP_024374953.1 uncharacterized protein LOC112282050 isoform X1 [Physcomitrella patens]
MAYSTVAYPGRDHGGANGFRLPDGYINSGNGELRKKLGSMDDTLNVDSPNQVKELVDIIEAAEDTIRTQVEETEKLRNALRVAEMELQSAKIEEQNQGLNEGYRSSQPFHGRNRSFQGQPGSVRLAFQHPMHQNGDNYGELRNGQTLKKSNGPSAADHERSVSPLPRRRGSEMDLPRDAYQGQVFSAELQEPKVHSDHQRSQDLMIQPSRNSEESNPNILKTRLMEASLKETQLVSEKRILERRVAELRLAYDQQQQSLVDAASKALSYRQNVLEENIKLAYALQAAEQETTTYVQNLMPLLAEFDLQPPVTDAHSIVSHIKTLVQKLRSELQLYESKAKDSQFYQQYQPSYQKNQSYNPPQSPLHQSNGLEIVPSYSQRPASPVQPVRTRRPSWDSGVSSPRYGGSRDNNTHVAGSSEQEPQVDAGAIVPHELGNATPNEGLEDLETDDLPYNGTDTRGDPSVGRPDVVRSTSPQLPSLPEGPNSPIFEDSDPLPGIVGLRIVGDTVLGGRLTACGHSINGTSLCIFQWVRHYRDGTAAMIEGAAQPEYTITADDCDSMVAIECVPMDERGRRGDLVTVMANDGNWINRDSMMEDQINSYMTNGHASFEVNLLIQEGASDDVSEPATLVLRRSNFELRRNSSRKMTINEKYAPDVLIKIPCGEILQCIISRESGGRDNYLELRDPRTRDMAVLTFRAFHKAAMDEKKKTRRKWLRH